MYIEAASGYPDRLLQPKPWDTKFPIDYKFRNTEFVISIVNYYWYVSQRSVYRPSLLC